MLCGMVIDGMDVTAGEGADRPRDHAAELLERVAAQDQGAFAQLYDLLSSRVFGLVLRVLVNRAHAEEVLQEVFLEIWQSAAHFAPNKGQGRAWIMTIAHRRAVDRVRSAQSSADRDERAGLRELRSEPAGVDEQVELRIESRRVARALDALPEPQREALTLAYFGGYSQSEISAMTGTALGTIKTRMRDGLSRLRHEMGVTDER
ncbi:MAG: ECF RNA polymerase sigma factor SigK [Microbacterium sp.]|uniref:ECF RNA polymerase sigma factor SigK n=1 Tax=Microbacterium sp. TaxID=51671 RepID=UPI001ACE6240|nr:ECF RNA polymerase sigma factor SigK [Microbacterium sp.]MBN9178802.1 ECF RNA polymerase sigma factor SigK [Microbacterium sp.]